MKPPLRVMQIQCCGIREVMSLPGFGRVSKKGFENWLRKEAMIHQVRDFREDDTYARHLYNYHWSGGVLMASVKKGQVGYEKWLRKVGFEPSISFRNHNTGNMVKIFFYRLEEGR